MSAYPKRLLSIQNLSLQQSKEIIDRAITLKAKLPAFASTTKVVALVFFEPSTRTSMSFEIAAHRLGLRPVVFIPGSYSSMAKGESAHETLENILSMKPDLVVMRHSGDAAVARVIQSSAIPVINAGDGKNEHPTQALLDAMTILECRGQIESEKIIFVGDVEHSRVARSNRALFTMLGAQVAVCAPEYLQPKSNDWADTKRFTTLDEALSWATVCMGLRVQKERHAIGKDENKFDLAEYINKFRIDNKNVAQKLKGDAIIMHPGPFVPGEDLHEEILNDSRCVIHQQVTNGVYIRMALLGHMTGVLV
jgi:aspartate carbamoyltransferase catalytic subunit